MSTLSPPYTVQRPGTEEPFFSDRSGRIEGLLAGIPIENLSCLDLYARRGETSLYLRARGARRVWAMDLPGGNYQGRANRFVRADLDWFPKHPHYLKEGPKGGFNIAVCGNFLPRFLPTSRDDLCAALQGLHNILTPKTGLLLFDVWKHLPEERPSRVYFEDSLTIIRQRIGDSFWESRAITGAPPRLFTGPCLGVDGWSKLLTSIGFSQVEALSLFGEHVRILARAGSTLE